MRLFRRPLEIIRINFKAYLVISAIFYGLTLAGFILGLIFPDLVRAGAEGLDADGTTDQVLALLRNPWIFALAIFGVNTFTYGVGSIILPSLIIPFAGIAYLAYRTVMIGIVLAPIDQVGWLTLIPHSLTVVIEFQAYILFVLGAYLLGKFWLRPQTIGAPNRRWGYLRGLQHIGWLSIAALALLVVGALYASFSLRYIAFPLIQNYGG